MLRVSFPIGETGFDPAGANDLYSNQVNRVIFDPLYRILSRAALHDRAQRGGRDAGHFRGREDLDDQG